MGDATPLGDEVGVVTGFFAVPSVAIIKVTKGPIKVGDTIWIRGHTTDLKETIQSMQIDHKPVEEAEKGKEIGIKVSQRTRRNDRVYKVTS